jgi:LPS-assembly protein
MSIGLLLVTVLASAPDGREVELSAERMLHDGAKQLTTAEGRATLRADGVAVDADRIIFSKGESAATATGHVVARLTQRGRVVVTGDVVTLRFDGSDVREVFLLDGRVVSKRDVSAEDLLNATTAEAALELGTSSVLLTGNHLTRDGATWEVDQVSVVPCDCDLNHPSWEIVSSSATVDTENDRVTVRNPVVYVRSVPVLWLPWLSLPLQRRQSGLLVPIPEFTRLSGVGLQQPVFLTLGRSADLTLTPGFQTGPLGEASLEPGGIAGPRLGGEFRYTPTALTSGRFYVGLVQDFRRQRDPANPVLTLEAQRGLRGEVSWTHTQDFASGVGVRTDLRAHSDGYYLTDGTADVLAREAGYLRSTAVIAQRGEDHLFSVDAVLRQDLSAGYDLLGRGTRAAGSVASEFAPGTIQRFPAVAFTVPRRTILGTVMGDVQVEFARFAPLFSNTGDEGPAANEGEVSTGDADVPWECLRARLYTRTPPSDDVLGRCGLRSAEKLGAGDRVFQPGEREARERLSVFPRLSLAATPLGVATFEAHAGYRQLGWFGEATGRLFHRGYPVVGAALATELSRPYSSVGLTHVLTPRAEVRAVPFVLGGTSSAPVAYDELDAAVGTPNRPLAQAELELRQRLLGSAGTLALRLDLGQTMAFVSRPEEPSRLGETFARLGISVGQLNVLASARIDPIAGRLVQAGAQASAFDSLGRGFRAQYEYLIDDGTSRTRRPIDWLFGTSAKARAFSQLATVDAAWRLWGFGLKYSILLADRVTGDGSIPEPTRTLAFAEHRVGVSYTPNCDCWRIEALAAQRPGPNGHLLIPDFRLQLQVSGFGTIGMR